MPFFGIMFFLLFAIFISVYTLTYLWKYARTRQLIYLKKLALIWIFPSILIGITLYAYYPITKDRVVGVYQIDSNFYPGPNANWQKEHFYFEITSDDQFLFHEKLKDGHYKTVRGKIEWYRQSPPMLYRIVLAGEHSLIDPHPVLYRGNRQFYYVFQSKFGNMFYRKVK